jgi:hypothetical protein
MRTTNSSFKFILAFLSGALCFAMLYLGSCKEEVPVSAVLQSRTVKGTVTDSITGDPINGAQVAITPPGGDTYTGSTSNGQFAIQGVPVLPAPQSYQVNVTAVGYESKRVARNCNCDILNIGLVPLKRLSCSVQFQPPTVDFGYVPADSTRLVPVTLSNQTLLDVFVTQITLLPPSAAFRLESLPQLPVRLAPLESRTFQIRFAPNGDTVYRAQVQASTTCDAGIASTAAVQGNGEMPKCSFISPNQIVFKDVFVGDTAVAYVIIRNTSRVTPLTIRYDQLPSDPAFRVIPARSPRTLAPGNSDTTFVVFIPPDSKPHAEDLRISTDGVPECVPSVLRCTGNALDLPPIVHGPTMDKWSCPTNPIWVFRGFRFKDRIDVPDSINLCGNANSCIPSPGPDGSFGKDSADFRFDGFFVDFYGIREGRIQAITGLQRLGNTVTDPLQRSFTYSNWRNYNPLTGWETCLSDAKIGDVIVVRTREGKYALIRVADLFYDPEPSQYQGLVWDYIYEAPPGPSSSIRLPH